MFPAALFEITRTWKPMFFSWQWTKLIYLHNEILLSSEKEQALMTIVVKLRNFVLRERNPYSTTNLYDFWKKKN